MRKKWYYILSILIIILLFSYNVEAATITQKTQTFQDNNGGNIIIRFQNFGTISPTEIQENTYNSDTAQNYVYEYNQNIQINLSGLGKYYSGTFYITLKTVPSMTGMSYTTPEIDSINVTEGVYCYIQGSAEYTQIRVIFDNYYNESGLIGLPSIHYKWTKTYSTETLPTNTDISFNVTPTDYLGTYLYQYSNPIDTGFAAVLSQAIQNALYDDGNLTSILNILNTIQQNDYSYYLNIIAALQQLHTDNGAINSRLGSILNEIDLDFQEVQTILDLFPSYRTQVLQYWQQLLEMNATQSSAAAEQASEYAERDNQSQQLINGMGSVSMPSISSGDLNILGNVDATQKANFFGLIGLITHTPIITQIMLIIVLAAIVGFILYGKRG